MGKHYRRAMRPTVEPIEHRVLLSVYTDLLISHKQAPHHATTYHLVPTAGGQGSAHGGWRLVRVQRAAGLPNIGGFQPSTTSVATPQNQGPQGTNYALAPTGNLTSHEVRLEQFAARFKGPYTIGAGRTDTEALQTFIRGAGTATSMLHSDIQLRIITPKDPAVQIGAVSAIFDRNLNSNTVLGFDATAPQQDAGGRPINVDAAGRPNHLPQISIDINESSGVYDEAFAQGVIDIRYIPSGKHTPGVISQGTAIVTIRAQIYGPRVDFILRNSDINP